MQKKYYLILILSYLLIICILIFYWIKQKNNIKKQLYNATQLVHNTIPESLIDSAHNRKDFPLLYYDSLRNVLTKTAEENKFNYLYVVIAQKDSIFFVISSFKRQDILNNMISKYLSPYYYYPSKIKKLDLDKPIMYLKYTDEYGSFFSAFHYYVTSNHNPYIIGADYPLDVITTLNWKFIFIILAVTIIFILAMLLNFNREYKIKK
jgi:hypothetical protein